MRYRTLIDAMATPWHSFRGGDSGAWLLHPADAHALDPVVLADAGEAVHVEAAAQGVHLAFFIGTPIAEPIFPNGPFIGSSAAEVTDMIRRYQSGQMGALAPTPGAFN